MNLNIDDINSILSDSTAYIEAQISLLSESDKQKVLEYKQKVDANKDSVEDLKQMLLDLKKDSNAC